jgi:hypothetical protein
MGWVEEAAGEGPVVQAGFGNGSPRLKWQSS